uniref:Uncharacterized protein n=1 Tax=Micrurus carvalhoi TaxID=3147026 RepID=A0A2H6N1L0_9SAUR
MCDLSFNHKEMGRVEYVLIISLIVIFRKDNLYVGMYVFMHTIHTHSSLPHNIRIDSSYKSQNSCEDTSLYQYFSTLIILSCVDFNFQNSPVKTLAGNSGS